MTDKSKKRRRDLAKKLNVGRRTAANIFRARRAAKEPMQSDVMVRRLGSVVEAHYVTYRFDPVTGQTFEDALVNARREAVERDDLLKVAIRRTDRAGHPWICEWTRETVADPWKFSWLDGADDRTAESLVLVEEDHAYGPFVSNGRTPPERDDGVFVGDGRAEGSRAFVFSHDDPGLATRSKASDAAYLTLAAAGFKKLTADQWKELEAAGLGLKRLYDYGGINYLAPTFVVRFYTRMLITSPMTNVTSERTVVFSMIIDPDVIHSQITTEPEGGIVYSGGSPAEPPTVEGAIRAVNRLLAFARPQTGPVAA